MDLLKAVLYLLFASVAMNLVSGMLPYADIDVGFSGNVTAGDPDPGGLVDTWTETETPYYEVGTGLWVFWNLANTLIQGVPSMLEDFGLPFWVTEPLYWYYRLLWLSAIALGVIAARQT